MDREDCSCRSKGRLLVCIESKYVKQVQIILQEENSYRDYYTVYLENGLGKIRIDSIAYGKVKIETSIDGIGTIYYPDSTILFQKSNYIHKVNIIDRRKQDDKL